MNLNELGLKLQVTIILVKFVQTSHKLSMAYSFWKTFFVGQNLKHFHTTCSFLELLIFFWLTLVCFYYLKFISPHIKEIFYVNTNSKRNQSWNKNKHFHLFSDIDVVISCLLNVQLKFLRLFIKPEI